MDVTSRADTPETPAATAASTPQDPAEGHTRATDPAHHQRDSPATPPGNAPDWRGGPGRGRSVRRRVLRVVALGVSLLAVAAAGTAWVAYRKLDANIQTDDNTARVLGGYAEDRPQPLPTEAENILLIGTDDRSGENREYGRDGGTQRSDTTILLHLAADRGRATAVSIPRDLMVNIPGCRQANGTATGPRFAQFNWAFQFGGAACTIRTVEELTGIRIDHHLIVDFTGFKSLVDAVGGVDVCLPEPVRDEQAKLDLPAGPQTVSGEDALAYVRARKSFGDGSDTQRMGRQQMFLASLVKKIQSNGVLLNPARLYPMLDAATSSLTADAGLDSLSELYRLARSLRGTPADQVAFLTVPRRPYSLDPNRDELVRPAADELFAALRDDVRVEVGERGGAEPSPSGSGTAAQSAGGTAAGTTGPGRPSADGPTSAPETSASRPVPEPTYQGTTANHDICGDSPTTTSTTIKEH